MTGSIKGEKEGSRDRGQQELMHSRK
jgi:hypothetical protein